MNARGERKLMGVGQRVVAGGVHVGGVVVVDGAERVNGVLRPVYAALGLDWRPEATGSVADEVPTHELGRRGRGATGRIRRAPRTEAKPLDEETLTLAKRLAPEQLSPELSTEH